MKNKRVDHVLLQEPPWFQTLGEDIVTVVATVVPCASHVSHTSGA